MKYCKAYFERGSGIGTRLFPWARATYFSRKYGVKMLAPYWVQPRIGPLLRGGIDLNAYHRQILLLGLFKTQENHISGIKRYAIDLMMDKASEPDVEAMLGGECQIENNKITVFSGDNGRFKYLNGMSYFFRNELVRITEKKWLDQAEKYNEIPIGINVRMGNDFVVPEAGGVIKNAEAVRTPLKWFVDSLKLIRKEVGKDVPAIVVSDGTEEALYDLLKLPAVTFLRPGCAISDLLVLSNCKVLLRSGGSSFSAWAAYLGQMPTISPIGQGLEKFNLVNEKNNYIGDFDANNPNAEFMMQVNDILRQG